MANQAEDTKEDKTSAPASEQQKESDGKKVETTTDQADDQKNEAEETDYAAELVKVQSQLKQAEHTIVDLRQKKAPEKKAEESVDEDAVDQKIDQRFSALEQTLASTAIASTLTGMSSDPDERSLIMFHYNNSIKKSGTTAEAILADLENAKVLANKRRILRENAEIKRSIAAKNTMSNGGRGSNQDKEEVQEQGPKLTEREIALLARRGKKPSDVIFTTR